MVVECGPRFKSTLTTAANDCRVLRPLLRKGFSDKFGGWLYRGTTPKFASDQPKGKSWKTKYRTITVAHVETLLKATPPEQRADVPPPERDSKTAPMEQLVKLEKEMSQVQATYKDAESNYGSELLNLVVAKGYLTKLLANAAVKSYIERREPEILSHLELVANTVSMEEAVQQQQGEPVLSVEG